MWVRMPTAQADERGFAVIRRIRAAMGRDRLPLPAFKQALRRQFFMLLIDEAKAIETLPALLPEDPAQRARALAMLREVVGATGDVPEAVAARMARIEQIFVGSDKPAHDHDGKVRRLRPKEQGAA
jgi:hypothetical protein